MAGAAANQGVTTGGVAPLEADKWTILRDLTDARTAFGLSDRNLSVLSALLSFHPARDLSDGPLTVFPSNASLSARLHGMPESTLRRHLAADQSRIDKRREDSPNGKRYLTRDGKGRIDRVFGFDLFPLLCHMAEIGAAARTAREAARQLRRARQSVVLLLRDIAEDLDLLEDQTASHRARLAGLCLLLRRKLDLSALSGLEASLRHLRAEMGTDAEKPPQMSGNDAQNERHHHNSAYS